jgi:RNA-directed DNA polymerase
VKRWNKVKALQYLITRSFSAKAMAVKRVTSNRGKHTAGIDGIVWKTSREKLSAISQLKQRGYKPLPLRRIYIPKSDGGRRPLGIPTMKDRAMQALYLMGLCPVAETTGDIHSYGFRVGRSTADAISQIFTTLANKNRATWILEVDIKQCFDHIDHTWLLDSIPMEKTILGKWLKAGYIEKQMFYPTQGGTPQGGIISPTLANMALDGLENVLADKFGPKNSYRRSKSGVHLIRYADDMVIIGRTKETLTLEVLPLLEEFLAKRGLALSSKKTAIVQVRQGFDFISQNVRKYGSKLIIKPSKDSIKWVLARIRKSLKELRTHTQACVIGLLNPLIRGWGYYHKSVCSRKTFEKVDHEIFQALWRWAKRRHPNKGLSWIKNRYFKVLGNQQWGFAVKVTGGNKKVEWKQLFKLSSIPIRRHIKIRANANPFDKEWYGYFAQRIQNIVSHRKGSYVLSSLGQRT